MIGIANFYGCHKDVHHNSQIYCNNVARQTKSENRGHRKLQHIMCSWISPIILRSTGMHTEGMLLSLTFNHALWVQVKEL